MPEATQCPRCQTSRLAVVYYDAEGRPLGGHLHCPECGARHASRLVAPAEESRRPEQLRKAS